MRDMIADKNKTEITLRVTEAANKWLNDKGVKLTETEVMIQNGWQADLAGVVSLTPTAAQNLKLIPRSIPWDKARAMDKDIVAAKRKERDVAYNFIPEIITIIHEVKTARQDFRGDKKWNTASPVDMRVLSITEGIISPEDYPAGWWVVLHDKETGRTKKLAQVGHLTPVSDKLRLDVTHSILRRRHNRTEYSYLKGLQQSHKNEENEYINIKRLRYVSDVVFDVVHGNYSTVEQCLAFNGYVRAKMPKKVIEKLESLHNIVNGGVIDDC